MALGFSELWTRPSLWVLYSVGGGWKCGALVDRYLQGETEELRERAVWVPLCPPQNTLVQRKRQGTPKVCLSAIPSSTTPIGRIIMTMVSSRTQSTFPNSTLCIWNPIVKMLLIWEKRSTLRKPFSNAILPQIAHGPAQERTWASVVKGRQLTAWLTL